MMVERKKQSATAHYLILFPSFHMLYEKKPTTHTQANTLMEKATCVFIYLQTYTSGACNASKRVVFDIKHI